MLISKTLVDRAISTKFLTHRVSLQSSHPNFQKKFLPRPKWRPCWIFQFFTKIAKHKNAYISKTMLDRVISTNFLKHGLLCRVAIPIFKKKFVTPKMTAILNYRIFRKNFKTKILISQKTVLDRADYADFGCHNGIRLKAEHFLNTLALAFIAFSGCKNIIFFASDPLVVGWSLAHGHIQGALEYLS